MMFIPFSDHYSTCVCLKCKPPREPHIWTPAHDHRPFEDYTPQPDTAERTRLAVQSIPFALPEKRDE